MKYDIERILKGINDKHREGVLWRMCMAVLSFFIFFFTSYLLILPAMALDNDSSYTLHLRDSYNFDWKTHENGYTTSYDLKLHFMDTKGNVIEGNDITIEIGSDKLADDPYAFGYVPKISATSTDNRGSDLIEVLNLGEYITSNGAKYSFDHAEVYVDGAWHELTSAGIKWHIWCQNSSSSIEPANKNYSWRGKYGDTETLYTINNAVEYKLVYQLVRYGNDFTVPSLGVDSGITFKMFNYEGDNDETGINANGIYDYFTFRDSSKEKPTKINSEIDGDGFKENRAKVLPNLDKEGYPVFDCQGQCDRNPSLGYLFGSSNNPLGVRPVGVITFNPNNTLLQKEIVDEVEYYYYDSNLNAVDYDIDNDSFLVRNYTERAYSISTYKDEADRYEFIPFNYFNNTKEILTNSTTGLDYNYEQTEKDNWYGMTMEFEFYMPRDGKIKDKDMIFSFSGDDDVWVFIDDVLVLDLGGTHGAVDGSINFSTGRVESYLNWNGTLGSVNVTNIYQRYIDANSKDKVEWKDINNSDGVTKIYDDYTKHTLKFFYLERGAAVANCKIRFNIPVLPSGTLSVGKAFEGIDRYNTDYEFLLYDVTSGSGVVNTEYTVGENKFRTDNNGIFKLKTNEVAVFNLTNEHKYYVEEINTGNHAISHKCSFDGEDCFAINKTKEFVMNPESAYQAIFTNKVKTYSLDVSKTALKSEINEEFLFKIQLRNIDGTLENVMDNINSLSDYDVDSKNGIITYSLKSGENIIINGIPTDTEVILKEVLHDGYSTVIKLGDITLADGDTYKFIMDSDKQIEFLNIPGVTLPETGGYSYKYLVIGITLVLVSMGYGIISFLIKKEGG